MKQKIGGHRELEIEGGLLEHDAEHRQRRHRIAPHIVPHDLDAAGIGHEQSGQKLEQRGLAGAVRTQERDEFAGGRREADAVDRVNGAVGLDHVVEQKRGRAFVRCHSFPGSLPPPLNRL